MLKWELRSPADVSEVFLLFKYKQRDLQMIYGWENTSPTLMWIPRRLYSVNDYSGLPANTCGD